MDPTEARVLAECAESPDDDAPRLVWADLVGGERGELVVLQCDLARGGLSAAATAARRRRERALLTEHGVAWAGKTATIARRWSFRRGFVEAVAIDIEHAAELDEPLVSALTLAGDTLEWLPRLPRLVGLFPGLRGLALESPWFNPDEQGRTLRQLARDGVFDHLRAFGCARLGSWGLGWLMELLGRAAIEQLSLPACELDTGPLEVALSRARGLVALDLADRRAGDGLPEPLPERPLRALRIDVTPADLLALARGTAARSLEHLSVTMTRRDLAAIQAWAELARATRLRSLEVAGAAEVADALANDLVALPTLRALKIRAPVSLETLQALVIRYGAQLELLDVHDRTGIIPDALHAGVAGVAGELVVNASRFEPHALVAGSVAAMWSSADPCAQWMGPAALIRLDPRGQRSADTERIWDLSRRAIEERIVLGRSLHNEIGLPSSSVGRRHAAITWRAGQHHIEDFSSTNGTLVNGMHVQRSPLCDGDELLIGEVLLRFFAGHDAFERARAALAATADLEPFTGLPRRTLPARVRILAWKALVERRGTIFGHLLMRALARRLATLVEPADQLTFVEPGCFGVAPAAAVERLAGHHVLEVDGEPVELEIG